MTVDAADVALVDLGLHARPTLIDHHVSDVGQLLLRIAMVELQDDRVRDAAVDAGMLPQV